MLNCGKIEKENVHLFHKCHVATYYENYFNEGYICI